MPQNSYSIQNAPRYTGPNGIPSYASTSITSPPTTQAYPVKPPDNVFGSGFAIAYGVDDKLRTPYSVAADFSVQRELPHGFTLEATYVGRFGRHLLQQLDLAQPTDFRDPNSGMDFTILPQRSSTGHSTPVQQPSPRFHTGKIYFRMQQQAAQCHADHLQQSVSRRTWQRYCQPFIST